MEARGCVLCILLLSFALGDAKYFRFEDCSKKDAIAKISKFQIFPDPIDTSKNTTVNLTITTSRDVPEDAVLETRYYKKKKSFYGFTYDALIPCFFGKFGSCTLKLCEYMDIFKLQGKGFFPKDKEYGCPIKAGVYGGENVDIPKPNVQLAPRYLVIGKYRTEVKLLEKPGGKELACFKIWTEVV